MTSEPVICERIADLERWRRGDAVTDLFTVPGIKIGTP